MKTVVLPCLFLWLMLAGCSSFKPVLDNRRTFVLVSNEHLPPEMVAKGIGISRVEIPDYLKLKAIAIRNGSEVKYSRDFFWAESLDTALQRTIAVNLGLTNVYRSFWRRDQVAFEVYVTIDRFDFDDSGKANLKAFWRLTRPGASESADSGTFETRKAGPRLQDNPEAATLSLSAALGELTDVIRQRIDLAHAQKRN